MSVTAACNWSSVAACPEVIVYPSPQPIFVRPVTRPVFPLTVTGCAASEPTVIVFPNPTVIVLSVPFAVTVTPSSPLNSSVGLSGVTLTLFVPSVAVQPLSTSVFTSAKSSALATSLITTLFPVASSLPSTSSNVIVLFVTE